LGTPEPSGGKNIVLIGIGAFTEGASRYNKGVFMGMLAKGRPALSFGVASARFGFVTVCVMAAGAALLTWLPQSDAYKPVTYPAQAIADSVTKGSSDDSNPVHTVRKGLEEIMNLEKPFYEPPAVQPTASKSAAPAAPPAPRVSAPAPAAPTSYPESSFVVPAGAPEPAPAAPAGEPVPAPADPASEPPPTLAAPPKAQEPSLETPARHPNALPKEQDPPSETPLPPKGEKPTDPPDGGPSSPPPALPTGGPSSPPLAPPTSNPASTPQTGTLDPSPNY
jgi:hypothetical protein